ncbi:serine hydrolase [Streptomyces sp. NPDC012888]|uniref:serine hydrolase n=1 Tax=Streptomyces sp. NPDC012888 TaxID=3364855 RepID=UPI003678F9C1
MRGMHTMRGVGVVGGVVAGLVLVLGGPAGYGLAGPPGSGPAPAPTPTPAPSASAPAEPPAPKPVLTRADVDRAVGRLDAYVAEVMRKTGVPGVAVAVVHEDEVVRIKGYGVREAGKDAAVNAGTVFRLASVSKPVSSTVVSTVLDDPAGWDSPARLPGFALKDPWVTDHVTLADLFSHRSGLPDHTGDLLEDLGWDQRYILDHLRLAPLTPFRASYAYTNFGLTAAAEAVARREGTSWAELSQERLFGPAGMTSTATTYDAYMGRPDRAVAHAKDAAGRWVPTDARNPDAQAPAGGVSSNATDMARWMRLQLAGGTLDGKRVVAADTLARTHLPEIVSAPPATPDGRTGFYGLGWNVSYDDAGRLRLSHSGGFELGANTNVTMLPLERLGIVVLTNAAPVGQADAIALNFMDDAQHGRATADWLSVIAAVYAATLDGGKSSIDWAKPPADPAPARADSEYTGTYRNDWYGPARVTAAPGGGLVLTLGPPDRPRNLPLTHWDGDTFSVESFGENAVGRTPVTFRGDTVRIEWLDQQGQGTFTR